MRAHNFIDLAGKKFGRLTALSASHVPFGPTLWLCKCDCGMPTFVRSQDLRHNRTRSCGCLRVDSMRAFRAKQMQAQRAEAA